MSDSDDSASTKRHFELFLPDLSLLGVALIWGLNVAVMKMGLGWLDNVFVFNAIRLPISAAVLAAFAYRERLNGVRVDSSVKFSHIATYCLMVSVLYQLVFLIGMNFTTPGNAALILATVPMWTAGLAWLFIGERLKAISWLGLVVALVGTIVVAVQNETVSADRRLLLGNCVMLLSTLLWAGGTVYSKPLLDRISPMQLAASASLLGVPAHILFAWLATKPTDTVQLNSPALWLVMLFSGVLSSGLAQPMWHFGVRHAGAAHAAIVQNLIPLVTLGAAWLIWRTPPTGPQLVGGALILSGLFLMRCGRFTRR